LVPATTSLRWPRCGRPRNSRAARMASSPSFIANSFCSKSRSKKASLRLASTPIGGSVEGLEAVFELEVAEVLVDGFFIGDGEGAVFGDLDEAFADGLVDHGLDLGAGEAEDFGEVVGDERGCVVFAD